MEGFTVLKFDAGDAGSGEVEFFNRGVEAEFAAMFLEDFGHAFGDFAETSLNMVDAVFVFEVRENGEEGGALPG